MYLLQTVKTNGGSWLMGDSKPTVAGMPGTLSSSLTWETVQSLNIGFDLGMLRNRLNINSIILSVKHWIWSVLLLRSLPSMASVCQQAIIQTYVPRMGNSSQLARQDRTDQL